MRKDELKNKYNLEKHPEGGWFSEVYTCLDTSGGRALAGSIYFLLDGEEISHFHRIDCDEVWYFHEGCGLKITVIYNEKIYTLLLGMGSDEYPMAVIPKGAVFAAENVDHEGYTFMSCMTAPKFSYEGFELMTRSQLFSECPGLSPELYRLIIDLPSETSSKKSCEGDN